VNDMGKNILLWLVIAAVLLTVFQNFNVNRGPEEVEYSTFLDLVNGNQIRSVRLMGSSFEGKEQTAFPLKPFSPKSSTKR